RVNPGRADVAHGALTAWGSANKGRAVQMPTRGSDGGENIDCAIHEVGEVLRDKGIRFALSGVCKYQVARGNVVCLDQPNPPAPNKHLAYKSRILGWVM
ncbi:MAG: hypothetical protein ACKPKO_61235, partial [Candidatus Fonsibacter sp.]